MHGVPEYWILISLSWSRVSGSKSDASLSWSKHQLLKKDLLHIGIFRVVNEYSSTQRSLGFSDHRLKLSNRLLLKKLKKIENFKFIPHTPVSVNRDALKAKVVLLSLDSSVKNATSAPVFLEDSAYVRTQLVLKWWHFKYKNGKFDEEKTPCYDLWH